MTSITSVADKPLFEEEVASFGISLAESGTSWTKKEAPDETSIVIGTVDSTCYLVRFSHDKFVKFQSKAMSKLLSEWSRGAGPMSDWARYGPNSAAPDGALPNNQERAAGDAQALDSPRASCAGFPAGVALFP